MAGAPGLDALRRAGIAFRKGFYFLKRVAHVQIFLHTVPDDLPEIFLQRLTDDEDDRLESGFSGIKERIVQNDLARRTDRGQLLDPLAEAAADTGGHDD